MEKHNYKVSEQTALYLDALRQFETAQEAFYTALINEFGDGEISREKFNAADADFAAARGRITAAMSQSVVSNLSVINNQEI